MTYGDTVFLEAGKDVHRTLVSYLGDMWLIQAIHIILLVFTLTMCLRCVILHGFDYSAWFRLHIQHMEHLTAVLSVDIPLPLTSLTTCHSALAAAIYSS